MVLLNTIETGQCTHSGPGLVISLCGARFNGIRDMAPGYSRLVVFTDPMTSITLTMPENEVTIGSVWRAIRKHRADHFGIPQAS